MRALAASSIAMSLPTCDHCHGFVPARATRCPHCDRRRGKRLRAFALVGGALGGSAFAMTLMACYGRPRGEPSPYAPASAPTSAPTTTTSGAPTTTSSASNAGDDK